MAVSLCLIGRLVAADSHVRIEPLEVPGKGRPGFQLLDAEKAGLVPKAEWVAPVKGTIRETGNSGLAAGDVDGDGLIDLYVCGMGGPNVLYRNLGNWRFEDITARAGVACRGWRLSGAVFADIDGDADLDLIITSLLDHRNFLYLNDGKGGFSESLNVEWVYHPHGGNVAATLADVDGDNDLDMYMTGFSTLLAKDELPGETTLKIRELGAKALNAGKTPPELFFDYYTMVTEPGVTTGGQILLANPPNTLYLNDGDGGFAPVADRDARFNDYRGLPTASPRYPSHEALLRDVDADGDPDLYVANDFMHPDTFQLNDGYGSFTATHPSALRRTCQFSMGLDFSDINRDGYLDIMVVDMLSRSHKRRKTQMGEMQVTETSIGEIFNRPQIMQNTLQLNRGDGTWTEIGQMAGVKASEWSWGVVFNDVDLDGYEDLIVATGMTRDFNDSDARATASKTREENPDVGLDFMRTFYPELATRNVAYRNRGDLTFEYVSQDWGFEAEAVSGGIAQADFDNDGDIDLIINNDNAPLEIYRSETTAPRVAVRLVGLAPNTQAIGAKVRLIGGPGGPAPMEHEIQCGGGYASDSDRLVTFGTGSITNGLKLEIIWRAGGTFQRTMVEDVRPNHRYTVTQSREDPAYTYPRAPVVEPLFEAADELMVVVDPQSGQKFPVPHLDAAFDDFAYQPLLPNRLSQLGPGVSWMDVNGDGWDDMIVTTGVGGRVVAQLSDGKGGFQMRASEPSNLDQTAVLGWPTGDGKMSFLVGQSNYEQAERKFEEPAAALILDPQNRLTNTASLPGHSATTGPLALADVDGDGDLDIFVGGRVVPARYPAPADSRLFVNDEGKPRVDEKNAAVFKAIGMVTGAVFGDLDADGDPDLVLAMEWGAINVLINENGKFRNATKQWGLTFTTGWWNSVALGDLDGDGRLDIVAGNWGLNSKYERSYSQQQPLKIAYADFDTNGVVDIVEYHFDKQTKKMVPERGRSCSMNAMPFIGARNPTFEAFGSRSLDDIYGECLSQGKSLEAASLAHTVFLNRGGKFEAKSLPSEAQFAPVFGINIADFNGDGNEDVFVAQNFFASQRETPRSDGGRGLVMLGDGKGGLRTMAGTESGVMVYGEQRGSAVSDFDRDGRVDLAVTQNGSFARLFRNKTAKVGLRVSLQGAKANPTAVGATVRIRFADGRLGPVRPITAGSGYWSQDSPTVVLGTPAKAVAVEVRWPDGSKSTTEIPDGAKQAICRK